MGDFNETLASSKHSHGSISNAALRGMQAFQSAVSSCNLTDLTCTGPAFTWTNKQSVNPIAKKLDRVLVNDHWLDKFPQSYSSFEASGVSDHTRCWVRLETPIPGNRRPFKFFNFLASHPDFSDTVATVWEGTEPLFYSTSALYRFHKKLKLLKLVLRRLNKNKFGNIPQRTREAFDVLCGKQQDALQNPTPVTFEEVAEATIVWNYWAEIEESFLRQKSRITWLLNGDQNTLFFFRIVQSRASFNLIRKLLLPSGETITDPKLIKLAAAAHFESFLKQTPVVTNGTTPPVLSELLDYRCPPHTAQLLTHPISEAEIRHVLFSMPSSKAPGPDGFPAEFYRASWHIIKDDFGVAVQSFFMYGFLPRGVNATILTLIPKHDDAKEMKDYRPISCCNILYKVISKVLANRLKVLLPELIEPNQCAFVKGRYFLRMFYWLLNF